MTLNQIYLGDTLDVLNTFPDDSIDIIVTSPPFNKMGMSGKLVGEVKYNNSSDSYPEKQYQEDQITILNELYRVAKPHGYIFYDHKLRWVSGDMIHPMFWLVKTRWNIRQEIVWDRGIAANIQSWRFWQTEHRIYWMQKGIIKGSKMESRHAKMSSIWRLRPENGQKEHPAPFPIELPTRCIYSIADLTQGMTILDPYSGTGTTLVAAAILGHNYIGIDCSSEYNDIANARVRNCLNSTDFKRVRAEQALHTVKQSYKQRKAKTRDGRTS